MEKMIVRGEGVNNLMPFKYPWAWTYFTNSIKNHWTPLDINMTKDVSDYKNSDEETRHLYENTLAYLSTSDILAMRNIAVAIMEKITAPEVEQYQARQISEEALHTWSYSHAIETIGLDQEEIYNRYNTVPEIKAKVEYATNILDKVCSTPASLSKDSDLEEFMYGYYFFSAIFEGTWFYNGFTPIFSLYNETGKFSGTSEQLQYIMRDEIQHFSFGLKVLKTICEETGFRYDQSKLDMINSESLHLESEYAKMLCPNPREGYNYTLHSTHSEYVLGMRLKSLEGVGVVNRYKDKQPTINWLGKMANINKEKNFFETRVTEYQTNVKLEWD